MTNGKRNNGRGRGRGGRGGRGRGAPRSNRPPAGKRTNGKRRGRTAGGTSRTIQRGYLPFGREFFARLPYVENFPISADGTTGLTNTFYTFRTNEAFDPRFELGGHQPLQYDNLAVAYERVWVHGAKVMITFSNPTHDGMYVGYRVRGTTNTVTTVGKTLDYIQEMRDMVCYPLNNTGTQTKTMAVYVPNAKVLGISKEQYANLEYSHLVTGNVNVPVLVEPFALHTVSGETASVRCNIKIVYFCQFTNPITQPQS